MIYGETGTLPLSITINKRMINFWLRIITSDPNKLSFKIYKHIIQLDNSNVYSTHWLSHIKQILQQCGLFYVWLNQVDIIDVCTVKLLINTRIDDMYEQTWNASIPSHVRCSCYVLFKSERKLELYLYKLNDTQRINLSKFRCRSNYLPISKVYKEHHMCNINCIFCNHDCVGDEYHYLFICSYFAEERKKYLKKYYRQFPSVQKFSQLMNSSNIQVLKKLANFVAIIMRKFKWNKIW